MADEAVMKVTITGEDDNEDEDEEDGVNFVVDYEMNIDSVPKTQEKVGAGRRSRGDTLTRRWRYPWRFRVTQAALDEWNEEAEGLDVEGPEERVDKGKGKKVEKGKKTRKDSSKTKGKEVQEDSQEEDSQDEDEDEEDEEGNEEEDEEDDGPKRYDGDKKKVIKCGRKNSRGGPYGQNITILPGGFDNRCKNHRGDPRLPGFDECNKKL